MIVKELIEELKKFDENMIVICQGEEHTEPSPVREKYTHGTTYWSARMEIKEIQGNTEFVIL